MSTSSSTPISKSTRDGELHPFLNSLCTFTDSPQVRLSERQSSSRRAAEASQGVSVQHGEKQGQRD